MRLPHLATALILAAGSPAAIAQPSQQHRMCTANAVSMVDSRECDAAELERQKALLNAEYKLTVAKASPADKAALEKAQKAWLDFRNADCSARSGAIKGSGSSDMYFGCMLEHTQRRTQQLNTYWSL